MKKRLLQLTQNEHFPLYLCTVTLALSILLTSVFEGMFLKSRITETEMRLLAAQADTVSAALKENEQKYVLKEYNGRIGIFVGDERTPKEVLSVYVFTLPEADRKALSIGIAVYGEEKLLSLIEDFTA